MKRLERVFALMEGEIGVLQVEKKIRNRVKRQMEKTQREYYLNEQMKAIQRELGERGRSRRAHRAGEAHQEEQLSKEAATRPMAELKKLRNMSPMSAEATVVRNYLDWLLSIPWGKGPRSARTCRKPRTSSTRTTTAWRRSRTDPGVSRGAERVGP